MTTAKGELEMKWTYEQLGKKFDKIPLPTTDYNAYYNAQDELFERAGWTREEFQIHLEKVLSDKYGFLVQRDVHK